MRLLKQLAITNRHQRERGSGASVLMHASPLRCMEACLPARGLHSQLARSLITRLAGLVINQTPHLRCAGVCRGASSPVAVSRYCATDRSRWFSRMLPISASGSTSSLLPCAQVNTNLTTRCLLSSA